MSEAKQQLLGVLQEATSQDYNRIRQAEEMLKQWESAPSFFATLQDIFYDASVEHDIRFMSGIYFKNSLSRFWEPGVINSISLEEKNVIRARLLQFIQEPSKKLTAQNAVIIAKIARYDYPYNWIDLFPNLMQMLESVQVQDQNQARLLHYHILEILIEVLLETNVRTQDQFAEMSPSIFQVVSQIYIIYVEYTINRFSQLNNNLDANTLLVELDIVNSCVKSLRILMMHGIKNIHVYNETKIFIDVSQKHLDQFMQCRSTLIQLNYQGKIREDLETLIEEYGSLYLGLQKAHPVSVVLCLSWLNVLKFYWQNILLEGNHISQQNQSGHDDDDSNIFEQFLLQGLLLINGTIKSSSSFIEKSGTDSSSITEEQAKLALEASQLIHDQFLTTEFVNKCAETLVTQYMILTPSDLSKWDEDPEGWANQVDAENWEFELHPCAEMTFMTLMNQYRDQLIPIILDLVERVANVTDYQGLLFKDAVYTAVGLGVNSLYGQLDFEKFIVNRLVREAVNRDPNYKVIRRRIAWVLGKWVTKDIGIDCKRVVYEILIRLMVKNEDLIIRLTAAYGLKQTVDDMNCDINVLLPYMASIMASVISLLNECEETDTTMKLISCVNTFTDRAGPKVGPFAPRLIQLLMPLWNTTTDPLLQTSLVTTFTKITKILNERSFQLQPFLIPILSYSTNPNNEAHIYLLEYGLDLWWVILQTTPMMNPFMMTLLPNAIELLDFDSDYTKKLLKIINSYILLDSSTALQPSTLVAIFTKLVPKILNSNEDSACIAYTFDLIFQNLPLQTYSESLLQSGLISNILQVLLQDQLSGSAIMSYMNLLARLTFQDPNFIIQAIQLTGQQQQMSAEFLNIIADKWISKYKDIKQLRARKLSCVGFTNLLIARDPVFLNKLPDIMLIWSDLGFELKENEGEILYKEALAEDDENELKNSAGMIRKRGLYQRDHIHTIELPDTIRRAVNDPEISALSSQIDIGLLNQIEQILS